MQQQDKHQTDKRDKRLIVKSYTPFTDGINEINNTQVDKAKYVDVVIPMHNLVEYSNNDSKTSGSLLQYYRDEPDDTITNSESFQSQVRISGNYLTGSSVQGVNRLFVLPVEYNAAETGHTGYFLAKVETKDCNVMINGRNFLDQPVENDLRTYESIQKITAGQGDDYIIGCLVHYPYSKENYKMIAIDLSKQQAFDADPTATQQTNFNGNLDCGAAMFFIIEEVKETILDFSQRTVRVL